MKKVKSPDFFIRNLTKCIKELLRKLEKANKRYHILNLISLILIKFCSSVIFKTQHIISHPFSLFSRANEAYISLKILEFTQRKNISKVQLF